MEVKHQKWISWAKIKVLEEPNSFWCFQGSIILYLFQTQAACAPWLMKRSSTFKAEAPPPPVSDSDSIITFPPLILILQPPLEDMLVST